MNSKQRFVLGWILSGLAAAFLFMDTVVKLIAPPPALEAMAQLGFPAALMPTLAILQFLCLAAYLVPRTAIIGAILSTGYLGGAIAVHMRVGNPLFSHTLFPLYIAAFLWSGLALRDRRVPAILARP